MTESCCFLRNPMQRYGKLLGFSKFFRKKMQKKITHKKAVNHKALIISTQKSEKIRRKFKQQNIIENEKKFAIALGQHRQSLDTPRKDADTRTLRYGMALSDFSWVVSAEIQHQQADIAKCDGGELQ